MMDVNKIENIDEHDETPHGMDKGSKEVLIRPTPSIKQTYK